MLAGYLRALKMPDLRKKLLFTLGMIVLFRFGSALPTPGISEKAVSYCAGIAAGGSGAAAGLYQLAGLVTGGALLRMSVFALGIMPYITASIILQLLVVVIPKLEQLKDEGQAGQAKITQYTRYLTLGLAVLQSTGYVELARSGNLFQNCSQPLIPNPSIFTIATMVVIMVAGTMFVTWMGELITDRGVGNGMSLLIFVEVVAVIPGGILEIGQTKGTFTAGVAVLVGIAILTFIVYMEQAQRRVPVQYAKRMVGRRMYGGTSTYIPLKVNQANVIPVIFSFSLLYIPEVAASFLGNKTHPQGWVAFVQRYLTNEGSAVYIVAYFVLTMAFTYFYVSITFPPDEVADNMKKYGGFIPGIRPGRPTAEYLRYILNRLTTPGALYLGAVSVIPMIAFALMHVTNSLPAIGISLIIMVGVGLETVKQIESQMQQRNYEGFLR